MAGGEEKCQHARSIKSLGLWVWGWSGCVEVYRLCNSIPLSHSLRYATGTATLLAPAFFYTLVHGMGLGLDGAALAFILCQVGVEGGVEAFVFSGPWVHFSALYPGVLFYTPGLAHGHVFHPG